MSRLMRMTYGHGGTKLERIRVSASHQQAVPASVGQRLLMLAVCIVVPVLVSLYAVPRSTPQLKTIIDISKLEIKPPPLLEKPKLPKPKPAPPIVKPVEPAPKPVELAPKPETIREPEPRKPLERQTFAPAPVETKRPTISRSSVPKVNDLGDYQPRVVRERARVETGVETVSKERIRRETAGYAAPAEKTTITRSRGATAMDSSFASNAKDRMVVMRRTAPSGGLPSGTGDGIPRQSMQRGRRSTGSVGPVEEGGQRVSATRERSKLSGGGGDGEGTSSVGLVRGVTLMSLEICSSPQKQEEAIKAVLSVVGSRPSCSDEKGEFQFKGTQRISSFNLMIFPSKGRRPSNRCEELDNAYKCLKTH